jgi:hypothetical protein
MNIFSGNRPDITPAQVGAALLGGVPVVANLLHAFGVYTLSKEEQDALTDTIKYGVASGGLLVLADAHLRSQRGKADAHVKAAALTGPQPPAEPAGAPVDDTPEVVEDPPTDEEEMAAPPGSMPVQPSQAFPAADVPTPPAAQ